MNAYITADRINEKRTAATANNSRPSAGETSVKKSYIVYHSFRCFSR
jgi:hypothetical protein